MTTGDHLHGRLAGGDGQDRHRAVVDDAGGLAADRCPRHAGAAVDGGGHEGGRMLGHTPGEDGVGAADAVEHEPVHEEVVDAGSAASRWMCASAASQSSPWATVTSVSR